MANPPSPILAQKRISATVSGAIVLGGGALRSFAIPLFSVLIANAATADEIKVLYNIRPPYVMLEGDRIAGLTGSVTDDAFRNAGIDPAWIEVPAARQLETIRNNREAACSPGWFRTPERETFALFTKPIYQDRPMAVLGRADDPRLAKTTGLAALLADTTLTLLVKGAYSYGVTLDGDISTARVKRIETTVENTAMVRLIALKRADFMFVAREEGTHLLADAAENAGDLALYDPPGIPPGNLRHIMCSKSVPPEIIERLNQVLPTTSSP